MTAARSGEVRGAQWAWIDPVDHVWTIQPSKQRVGSLSPQLPQTLAGSTKEPDVAIDEHNLQQLVEAPNERLDAELKSWLDLADVFSEVVPVRGYGAWTS